MVSVHTSQELQLRVVASPAFRNRESNPYNWLLYSNMRADVTEYSNRLAPVPGATILHVHWPEKELNTARNMAFTYARLRCRLLAIDRWRKQGAKLVWTVHNLKTHEQLHPRVEQWFWREFTSRVDGFIALSKAGLEAARREYPRLESIPGFVIPHGHYRDEYPNDSGQDARARLGIGAHTKVLLFFGKIRPYKNLASLISAFRRLEPEDTQLHIVGQPDDPRLEDELPVLAASDPRVHLCFSYIPKEAAQLYFRAADLVVLPFREILNSGSALLALSFNRPVLVPLLGAMGELAEAVGRDWVRTYTGNITTSTIVQSLHWSTNTVRAAEAPLTSFAWPEIATQTLQAYQAIAAQAFATELATMRTGAGNP